MSNNKTTETTGTAAIANPVEELVMRDFKAYLPDGFEIGEKLTLEVLQQIVVLARTREREVVTRAIELRVSTIRNMAVDA